MTADRPWAHLPNAKHINAVLADLNARPEVWAAARPAALDAARPAAWSAVRGAAWAAARGGVWHAAWAAVRAAARDAALGAVWGAARDAARPAVWDVIRALVAWDSAADLVDLPPDVLRTMIDLAPEPVNHQAVLLLPWAIVKHTEEVTPM